MKKRKGSKSELVCGACNDVAPIFRPSRKEREVGHIKHMYCSVCEQERPFIEHTAHEGVEKYWVLEGMRNVSDYDVEFSKGARIFNKELGEFLELEEQIKLVSEAKLAVPTDAKRADRLNILMEVIELRGNNIHLLEDNRPN